MSDRSLRGVLLAGGHGSRLRPSTWVTSKQLLPVYDKPMIYYPLSILMLAGVRDVLLIGTPDDLPRFRRLLGDGSALGIRIEYLAQPRPGGIAQAFVLGRDFLDGHPACLVLGDCLMFGNELVQALARASIGTSGGRIFGYRVADPSAYGVAEVDEHGRVVALTEKPASPRSHWAVPGVYFYGPEVCDDAARLRPGVRGELEITDLNRVFLERGDLEIELLGRGITWFDMGTPRDLLAAANFVASLQTRQGLMIGCIEEVALRRGWIERADVASAARLMGLSPYAEYLDRLLVEL